jgi:hypothetical protein
MNDHVELDIVLQKENTTFLHWSLPLCALLARESFRPWYYEHFVQLGSLCFDESGPDPGYAWIDYVESLNDTFRNSILLTHYLCLGYEDLNKPEIVQLLVQKIDRGYYAIVYLDEYFIPGRPNFRIRHFVHPVLLYGYDRTCRQFATVGFAPNSGLKRGAVAFDVLQEAFLEGEAHFRQDALYAEREIVQLLLPVDGGEPYRFDSDRFGRELGDYLSSTTDSGRRHIFEHGNAVNKRNVRKIRFGLAVYDEVLEQLRGRLEGKWSFDYRMIHLLAQHKRGLHERLKYVQSIWKSSDALARALAGYGTIADRCEQLCLNYLRRALEESSWRDIYFISPKNDRLLKNMIAVYTDARSMEATILDDLLGMLGGCLGARSVFVSHCAQTPPPAQEKMGEHKAECRIGPRGAHGEGREGSGEG